MGSICDVAEEVIDYLNAQGREGRPGQGPPVTAPSFAEKLLAAIPAYLQEDRGPRPHEGTRRPGRAPVSGRCYRSGQRWARHDIQVIGGRYGLGSKDTPPASVFAVYEELAKDRAEAPLHHRHRRRCHQPLPRGARPLRTPPRKAPSSASSGASAATAPSARTRTPSRSSATIPTSMCRPTSSTTPRRPAA